MVEDALSDLTCFSALVLEELTFLGSVQSTSRQRVLSIGRAFGLVLLASLALNLGSDTSVVATFFFIVVVGVYESVFRKLSDLSISIVSLESLFYIKFVKYCTFAPIFHYIAIDIREDTTVQGCSSANQHIFGHTYDTFVRHHLVLWHFSRRSKIRDLFWR